MGKIRLLSEDLISLISAGEVIENPSSIVKELIENSLDAGTDMIDISIEAGGINIIVVSDNGSGISSEDCEFCLHRYSTSKVSTKDDIDAISTYGFRGEALASIVAVSDVRNAEGLGHSFALGRQWQSIQNQRVIFGALLSLPWRSPSSP